MVDEQDDSQLQTNGRGPRSTGFPALSLPDAVSVVSMAAGYGRLHSMAAMAGYTGHTTANSGPFRQKLAALKDWGLVAVSGEAVTVTDRGMGIALPASPAAELDLLQGAFQGCSIFWTLYRDTAKGLPLNPDTIGNNAVTMYGISPKAREKFIKSFVDSATAVGLADKLPTGEVKLAQTVSPDSVTSANDMPPATHTPTVPVSASGADSGLRPAISQVWKNGDTEIIFEVRSSSPLPSAAFMEIGTAVTSIEVLWEALQPENQ
jgi:hypothetical protein